MKQLALVAVLVVSLVACGGGNSKSTAPDSKSVVLQQPAPRGQGIYVQITGPSAAVPVVARTIEQLRYGSGLVAGSAVHGHKVCSRTARLATYPATEPSLRGLGGRTISLAAYGDQDGARMYCALLFVPLISGGHFPLLGGNRTASGVFSPFMEPTLHCSNAQGRSSCLAHEADFAVVQPSGVRGLRRNAIVVFKATDEENQDADSLCEGEGDEAVRRVIGLPGETVREDSRGYISTRPAGASTWTKLSDPYIPAEDRAAEATYWNGHFGKQWHVPVGEYFVVSDDRTSCDSRTWGSVPAANIVGTVVGIVRDGKVLKPPGAPG